MKQVDISVQALYEHGYLSEGTIVPDFDEQGNGAYFDLYNRNGEFACCDGETCEVISEDDNKVILCNRYGDEVYFSLTKEEYEIATSVFNS